MMNLRKIFNRPNSKQKQTLLDDIKRIEDSCYSIARQDNNEQKEEQIQYNTVCPKCRVSGKTVDKIKSVVTRGDFSVDTMTINHCKDCGNEWQKFKLNHTSKNSIMIRSLRYIYQVLSNPEDENGVCDVDSIQIFNNSNAESIHFLYKKYYASKEKTISLRKLRKYYESIYEFSDIRI